MQGGGGGHIPGIGASVGGHRIGVVAGHGSRGLHFGIARMQGKKKKDKIFIFQC